MAPPSQGAQGAVCQACSLQRCAPGSIRTSHSWNGGICGIVSRKDDLYTLPKDLPVPLDDGFCAHLTGMKLPAVGLQSTEGRTVYLADLPGRTVVYCYPRTGTPDRDPPRGWNEIPGARGCTPQALAFRDHHKEFRSLGATVFGLSTQTMQYQQEAVERLKLPFELLSDAELVFTKALKLPTFEVEGMTLLKRVTLIIFEGRIEKVFYPVFPPHQNALEAIKWFTRR